MGSFKIQQVFFQFILSTVIFASGCGGGGGGVGVAVPVSSGTPPGYTVSGKVAMADGTPVLGASLKLYRTTFSVYSTNGLYGANNITLAASPTSIQTTAADGSFTFSSIASGSYTIRPVAPALSNLVFKWKRIPTLSDIGIITIADNSTVYIFDQGGSGNHVTADGTIIYNTTFVLTGNTLSNEDIEASIQGGASN